MTICALPIDRRTMLKGGGAGILAIAVPLPRPARSAAPAQQPPTPAAMAGANAGDGMLTAYVVVDPNGDVRVLSPVAEMGQGTHTAHAAIIADELGVDLARVTVETALPADPYRAGGIMMTSGSAGVRRWLGPLRKGAAQARDMLRAAAAARLSVPLDQVVIEDGMALDRSGRRIPIGALVPAAAALPPPADPALKPVGQLRYRGRTVPRLDVPAKVRGTAVYGLDFRLPGLLYACAALTPVFHGDIQAHDDRAARAVAGVRDVVRIPGGVAVVAETTWAALRGAALIQLTPAPTAQDDLDSARIDAAMRSGLDAGEAPVAKAEGDLHGGFAAAVRTVEADYAVPYLSHAPLEPFAATLRSTPGMLEIWAPTQFQERILRAAARAAELPADRIVLRTGLIGGAFGRRLTEEWVAPAVAVARALAGRPVTFFWSRETEFAQGWYRPAQMARLKAGLAADGSIRALSVRIAGPSLRMEFLPAFIRPGDLDPSSVQDLPEIRYARGAYRLDNAVRHVPVTAAPWRAVGATHNAFFLECFIDELAQAAGRDPVDYRRGLLAHDRRALEVVSLAADRGGWFSAPPAGRARGFAFFESYGSLCAQVVEVSLEAGRPRVHRVTAVLDCGEVLLPDAARSQVEGSIIQGLSAALYEAATIADGAAMQRNFDSYRIMTFPEAPEIAVHLIGNGDPMGGVGEPGLPPVAPAVTNALHRLTGRRIRRLPLLVS